MQDEIPKAIPANPHIKRESMAMFMTMTLPGLGCLYVGKKIGWLFILLTLLSIGIFLYKVFGEFRIALWYLLPPVFMIVLDIYFWKGYFKETPSSLE